MVSNRIWAVINVSLGLIALILVLHLLGVQLPALGNAFYQLEDTPARCVASYKEQTSLLEIDLCCSQLQQQLIKGEYYNGQIPVEGELVNLNKHYYTGKSTINYFVNNKAYYYCRAQGFLV